MKTSWRGFAANTWVAESTCTWLRSLFSRRVAHCVDARLVSHTHLCACTHTHTHSDTSAQPLLAAFWWRPLDVGPSTSSSSSRCSRQLQQTRHAGTSPVALATSHISADVPSSGLIFVLLLGLFVRVCVGMCTSICMPLCVCGWMWTHTSYKRLAAVGLPSRCVWSLRVKRKTLKRFLLGNIFCIIFFFLCSALWEIPDHFLYHNNEFYKKSCE